MDQNKEEAAKHHEEAAKALEVAAKLHHDAAKQVSSGNFPKAQTLAVSAAEADTAANLHANQAADAIRAHDDGLAATKAGEEKAEAARAAKKEAKA